MTEASKESPAPLDGYVRAKPNEPLFPLQGGDRFAIPTVRFYIDLRRNAGIKMPDGPSRDAELLRCTEAEKVLWSMESYLRDQPLSIDDNEPEQESVSTILDLHDYRVHAARRIANAAAELDEIQTELLQRDFFSEESLLSEAITQVKARLDSFRAAIDPRNL